MTTEPVIHQEISSEKIAQLSRRLDELRLEAEQTRKELDALRPPDLHPQESDRYIEGEGVYLLGCAGYALSLRHTLVLIGTGSIYGCSPADALYRLKNERCLPEAEAITYLINLKSRTSSLPKETHQD